MTRQQQWLLVVALLCLVPVLVDSNLYTDLLAASGVVALLTLCMDCLIEE